MANKQVKLTEQQLREIISEAVRAKMNEDNFVSRWWNRKDIDKYSRLANKYAQEYRFSGNEDDYNNYEWALSQLSKYDKNKAAQIKQEWDEAMNAQPNNEEQPFNWNPDSNGYDYEIDPTVVGNDNQNDGNTQFDWSGFENQNNNEEGASNDMNIDIQPEEPAQNEPEQTQEPEQVQSEPEVAPNPAPQHQQPAYQRGKGYNLTFNQENEDVFNNYISPAYNSVTNAMKALQNLEQLGEQKYNETSKIWNDYGSSNLSGAQANYKQVCQQINSILPTLQSIKAEMKQILYANGVRQSADYQHFGMEESKLRQIVSNSIQKILKENLVRKSK